MAASALDGYRQQLIDGLYPSTTSLGDETFARNLYITAGLSYAVSALHVGYIGARFARRHTAPLWVVRTIERPEGRRVAMHAGPSDDGRYRVPHASVFWARRVSVWKPLTSAGDLSDPVFRRFGDWLAHHGSIAATRGAERLPGACEHALPHLWRRVPARLHMACARIVLLRDDGTQTTWTALLTLVLVMLESRRARREAPSWLRMPTPASFAALALLLPVAAVGVVLPIGIVMAVDTARLYKTGNTAIALLDSVISGQTSLADALGSQASLTIALLSQCARSTGNAELTMSADSLVHHTQGTLAQWILI